MASKHSTSMRTKRRRRKQGPRSHEHSSKPSKVFYELYGVIVAPPVTPGIAIAKRVPFRIDPNWRVTSAVLSNFKK